MKKAKIESKNKKIDIPKIITSDRFLNIFPLVGLGLSILSFLFIIICSDNISIANPDYINQKTFTDIYEVPLKNILVFATIWAVLIAYKTYLRSNEQFYILNNAWIKISKVATELIPLDRTNKNIKKIALLFEITNNGNTPAYNTEIDAEVTSDIAELNIKKINLMPMLIYPNDFYTSVIDIGATPKECKEIEKTRPTFYVTFTITFYNLFKTKQMIIENYKFEYGKLPVLTDSKIFQDIKYL